MSWTTIQRREFLITTSQVVGGMVVSSILPATPTGAANSNLVELSATAAVAAIRNGDIKAENYARALLDRAQQLASLNAFRILDREMVLEAARNADKRRASGAQIGCAARTDDSGQGQRQHQGAAHIEWHPRPGQLQAEGRCRGLEAAVCPRRHPHGQDQSARTVVRLDQQQRYLWSGAESLRSISRPWRQQRRLGCCGCGTHGAARDRRGYARLDPSSIDGLRARRIAAELWPLSRRRHHAAHR